MPLLALDAPRGRRRRAPDGSRLRLLAPDDRRLRRRRRVVDLAFAAAGDGLGGAGPEARDARGARVGDWTSCASGCAGASP